MPLVSRESFQANPVWSGTESKHTPLTGVETGQGGPHACGGLAHHLVPAQADPGPPGLTGDNCVAVQGSLTEASSHHPPPP